MFLSGNLGTWPTYSCESDTFAFLARIWPLVFSSYSFVPFIPSSLLLSCFQAWPMVVSPLIHSPKFFPTLITPSLCSFDQLMLSCFRYILQQFIYVNTCFYITLSWLQCLRRTCVLASCIEALHNLEHFWGAHNPHFPYYEDEKFLSSWLMENGEVTQA